MFLKLHVVFCKKEKEKKSAYKSMFEIQGQSVVKSVLRLLDIKAGE